MADHNAVRSTGDGIGGSHDFLFLRLGVEGVDVAHAARHEKINHMFCLRNIGGGGRSGFGNAGSHHGE